MMKKALSTAVVASLATMATAECPNGCNGHGKCTSYDMCICNRNWQANDCSERVCQFGLAHVDTPKGDLDMSGTITGPDLTVAENSFNYPYGTAEQFPQGRDSDLNEVTNSAHYYMECSNKGTCNRDSGECECFDGYDGAACQRASCPGFPDVCSGHGVCKTIRQLAKADNDNIYELWDKHSTMGCECDDGFDGPDCSERKCKYGIDPLYYDDSTTIKYSTWDFGILTSASTADFTDGMVDAGTGYFAIRFFDMHGEDWVTEPIAYASTCETVLAALEALPNEVIPVNSLSCVLTEVAGEDPLNTATGTWSDSVDTTYVNNRPIRYPAAFWEFAERSSFLTLGANTVPMSGTIYRIKFAENPGALKEPEIEIYLDGKRASIATADDETLITPVWTDGQQGESVDYFADICAGVTVTISTNTVAGHQQVTLGGMTDAEEELLKACLGAADFDVGTNTEKYDWDYGSDTYPHLIKLVLTTASSGDGGYYAAVQYDGTDFIVMNQFFVPDLEADDNFDVYTTKGTLARVSPNAYARFGFASHQIITQSIDDLVQLKGDVSCEINDNNADKADYWTRNGAVEMTTCLNKTDIFTFLSTDYWLNPAHLNLYHVDKVYQTQFSTDHPYNSIANNFNGTFVIETDIATNYAARTESFYLYKFFPSTDSSYTYVSECSNRGICNTDSGLCECFSGYTNDDCSSQNSLAV